MTLQIESQIYKWLQGLKIIRDGKRGPQGKIIVPQSIAARLFDGLLIAQIAKKILRHRNEQEAANKLQAIKQNSTPAIRLYNWNLLTDALKKLSFNLDYSLKSKLLNLQEDALIKIIKYLWNIRVQQASDGQLSVSMSEVGQKSLKQASNVFQFLVISICYNFKLSVQHALNLFLDNNKYLAHLLVKGVKGTYQPVLLMLKDCSDYMTFIVDSLFCVDENKSLILFLGAIKPCLISKEQVVAEKGFNILKQLIEIYMQKGTNTQIPAKWMENDGLDTVFFSIKRHPIFFSSALSISYAYLQDKLFKLIGPVQKSLLWNTEKQKLAFYYQLLSQSNEQFIQKFIQSPSFEEWNRACLRLLKKSYLPQEQYGLIKIFQELWLDRTEVFQKSELGLPNAFILFLKNCASSPQETIFIQVVRVLFNFTVKFGLAKNPFAPTLYKAIISILSVQSKADRIEYLIQGFLQLLKDIPSLPITPIAQSILKLIEMSPSASILQMAKIMLVEGRLGRAEKQQLQSALAKLMFSDIHLGAEAQEILVQHLMRPDNQEEMQQFCSAALAQFYSMGRQVHRTFKQMKQDFNRYQDEQSMKRGEPNFLRNLSRYICMNNIILFIQKAIFSSINCKEQLQPHIFHTYIRIEKQLKKEYISRMLMPLLKSYYEQGILASKIEQYLQQTYPPIMNFQSLAHSQSQERNQQSSPEISSRVLVSKKPTLKTQQNNRSRGVESIRRQLDMLKKKRQQQRERSLQKQRQRSILEQKKQLYFSVLNEKRIVDHGKSRKSDVGYHNLFQFDTAKTTDRVGLPQLKLLDLKGEEQKSYIEDVQAIMKKYKKLWRFIFFRYSSFGLKGQPQGKHPQQKISSAEIWKFLKQYELQALKREEALALVKRINQHLKRKGDPQYLSYLGFQEYIIQYCFLAFRKSHPSNSPGRQIMEFVSHLRSFSSSKGIATQMFDSPEQMFFQQTDVIRQFNVRLSENPDYPLPQGYKKVRYSEIKFNYTISETFTGFKQSRKAATQVLEQILFKTFSFHMIQPLTIHQQRFLARPALFQKIKDKLKDYTAGYLLPKKSAYLPKIQKQTSPFKSQFHLFTEFSLGIKLGLAGVDHRNRYIADQVAYWLDDALDAVQAGRLKVSNKSKTHVQNQLIRKKMSEALQSKIQKQKHDKWQKSRAESVKNQAIKYLQDKKQHQKKIQQSSKIQRQKRRQQQDFALQKKKSQFQQAKSILQAKRKAIEEKKETQLKFKRKQKQEYKKNVQQYFKKKKEQLTEKSSSLKITKELEAKQLIQKKTKQLLLKQKLQIQVFRKQEQVLQKVVETRQSYQQAWKSDQIQKQIRRYRTALKLVFDLLLKYQKSKISSTGPQEIGLNTLNFYMLRTRIIPLLIQKNTLGILYKAINKNENHKGANFAQFEQLLFKIAVKGKTLLNSRRRHEDDQFQMIQLQKSLGKSNLSMQLRKNKNNLTDQYTLDANGVTELTVRRMMQYLNLIDDKLQAQLRFRKLLEKVQVKPNNILLKEAQSLLDSTVL